MPGTNPYDSDYDNVEADYIQFLGDAVGRLSQILRVGDVAPANVPPGAPELRARLEGVLEEVKEARLDRKMRDLRADLLDFFPKGHLLPAEDGIPAEIEGPAPDSIFEYVRASFDVYGDLLGKL